MTEPLVLNREKREAVTAALSGGVVMLHLDTSVPGVRVPGQFQGLGDLRLNVSYRYANVEVIIDESKLAATLSFNGSPFRCILPWESVWAVSMKGATKAWAESIPEQALQELQMHADRSAPPAQGKARHLRLVH